MVLGEPPFDDVHALTGSLKLYFRELPEPLIPYDFFSGFVEAISEFILSYLFFICSSKICSYNSNIQFVSFYSFFPSFLLVFYSFPSTPYQLVS